MSNLTQQTQFPVNSSPSTKCWRMKHDGKRVLSLEEGTGVMWTSSPLFCAIAREDVDAEITRLGLTPLPEGQTQHQPKKLFKSDIRRKLRELGREAAFNAFLTGLPQTAQDDYRDAVNLYDNDPMFVEYAPLVKAALELTDEQFSDLLD